MTENSERELLREALQRAIIAHQACSKITIREFYRAYVKVLTEKERKTNE